ncbi:MAG: hypothetical protein ABIG61_00570, partial [Planctomycetota bacterium]
DFDGFIWFKLFFSDPGQTIQLEALRVDFPIRPEVAKYCEHRTTTPYGAIAPNSNINFSWPDPVYGDYRNNYHWVGDEERGLGFAYRSLEYWQPTSSSNFCTVLARPAATTYRMNILQFSSMADGLVYEFGIQPTPIKPLPADWHSMVADFFNPSQARTWYKLGDYMDLLTIMPYSGHNGTGCNVMPGLHDPENVNACLATWVDYTHDINVAFVPGFCPQKLSETIPDVNSYLNDWRCVPLQQLDWEGVMNYDDCAGSEDFVDWFVYQWKNRVEEFNLDGLYFDGWLGIWPCKNEVHGCGWTDRWAQKHEIVPILEARTAMMRIATMLEDTIDSPYIPVPEAPARIEFPKYHLQVHSWQAVPPLMGFATSWVTGEYVMSCSPTYGQCLGLDKYRSRSLSTNWGVPQFWDIWPIGEDIYSFSRMVWAWTLPHGSALCYLAGWFDQALALNVYDAMRKFGTRKAEFTPSWRENNSLDILSPNSPNILVATWERKMSVLAVVSNLNVSDPNAVISLKWNKPFNHGMVKNALNVEPIPFDDVNDIIQLEIGPEDFKLLLLQADTDIDDDNDVDLKDLSVFVDEWLMQGNFFDFTDNNIVNFEDYAYLADAWTGEIVLLPPPPEPNLLFHATFNNGWDADYAAGDGTATVYHDNPDVYSDIEIAANGSGAFSAESPNNLALHHPGGVQHNNIQTGEYVEYDAAGNFSYLRGSYVAWVRPMYEEGGFTPWDGFIICEGSHWSYGSSVVLDQTYYYNYNADY